MRRQAARFRHINQIVVERWDEMPFPVKEDLRLLAERLEFRRPGDLAEWSIFILACFVAPVVVIYDAIFVREDSVTRYVTEVAAFITNVKQRVRAEQEASNQVWDQALATDPEFSASLSKGIEESRDGAFVEVDWKAARITTK
jgi:hypothetical protein